MGYSQKKSIPLEVPWWPSGLRIWHCHCFSSDSVPDLGTCVRCRCSQKKKKKKEKCGGICQRDYKVDINEFKLPREISYFSISQVILHSVHLLLKFLQWFIQQTVGKIVETILWLIWFLFKKCSSIFWIISTGLLCLLFQHNKEYPEYKFFFGQLVY